MIFFPFQHAERSPTLPLPLSPESSTHRMINPLVKMNERRGRGGKMHLDFPSKGSFATSLYFSILPKKHGVKYRKTTIFHEASGLSRCRQKETYILPYLDHSNQPIHASKITQSGFQAHQVLRITPVSSWRPMRQFYIKSAIPVTYTETWGADQYGTTAFCYDFQFLYHAFPLVH